METKLLQAAGQPFYPETNYENDKAAKKIQKAQNDITELQTNMKDYLNSAKAYADSTYMQATGYTDQKIADLINGAPATMDTLKEIADAMAENESVIEALDAAIGSKASEAEFQSHDANEAIHITISERKTWNEAYNKAKEVGGKLCNILEFIIDEETGEIIGYKTTIGGADTVFPFHSENIENIEDINAKINISTSSSSGTGFTGPSFSLLKNQNTKVTVSLSYPGNGQAGSNYNIYGCRNNSNGNTLIGSGKSSDGTKIYEITGYDSIWFKGQVYHSGVSSHSKTATYTLTVQSSISN